MNRQRKVLITITYNDVGIIIDTKAEEVAKPDLQPTCNNLATDLISRQDAIDVLEGGAELLRRVLDDTDIVGAERRKYKWGLGLIESCINDIEELPSAEPQIIRCKDCRNYAPYWGRCRHWERISTESILVSENDFCSRAERKDNG